MLFKKQLLIICIALASINYSRSQCITINLIRNPNLEEYNCCPNNAGMISCATDWTQPIGKPTAKYMFFLNQQGLNFAQAEVRATCFQGNQAG